MHHSHVYEPENINRVTSPTKLEEERTGVAKDSESSTDR